MLEAELKFEVPNLMEYLVKLDSFAEQIVVEYKDIYFDNEARRMGSTESELRIRTISGVTGRKSVLTAKSPPVEMQNKNKIEHEVEVSDPTECVEILEMLGFQPRISVGKKCHNYSVYFENYQIDCTAAELLGHGRYFIEIETKVSQSGFIDAIATLEQFALVLGLSQDQKTSVYYTDIVGGTA